MVDFWSKKAIQKKNEIFDEIVVKMAAPGRVTPGSAPSIPPEPPLGGRFAQVGITVRTRKRAFRHLAGTGTESAQIWKLVFTFNLTSVLVFKNKNDITHR